MTVFQKSAFLLLCPPAGIWFLPGGTRGGALRFVLVLSGAGAFVLSLAALGPTPSGFVAGYVLVLGASLLYVSAIAESKRGAQPTASVTATVALAMLSSYLFMEVALSLAAILGVRIEGCGRSGLLMLLAAAALGGGLAMAGPHLVREESAIEAGVRRIGPPGRPRVSAWEAVAWLALVVALWQLFVGRPMWLACVR